MLAYGNGGAGKTTLFIDFAVHLAAGRPWLALDVPRRCRVAWIENEGPRGNFAEKLDAKLHAWGDPLDGYLRVMKEPWGQFTFALEPHRGQLAKALVEHGSEVLIVGPVQTLGILGGGTPSEVGDFIALIEDMRARLDRPVCVVLIHHENRGGQVSGAWEGRPDTLVHVTAQGHRKTRLFWKKARWASDLHGTSWYLRWRDVEGFELDRCPDVTEESIAAGLVAAVRDNGGASWTKIRVLKVDGKKFVRGNMEQTAAVRDRLVADGTIVNTTARQGQFRLWLPTDPAAPRSPVSDVSRNGERERDGSTGANPPQSEHTE